jgi:hypothetical protein
MIAMPCMNDGWAAPFCARRLSGAHAGALLRLASWQVSGQTCVSARATLHVHVHFRTANPFILHNAGRC